MALAEMRKMDRELEAIGQGLAQIAQAERAGEADAERRFAEGQAAIVRLLESVQDAKASGQWHNTHVNVFEVLGRTHQEQAHSDFLAWLFKPAEAHGLGDAFLRQFMLKAIGAAPPTTDVTVTTEYPWHNGAKTGRFDVHIQGDNWRLVVENKINDSAWLEQCGRYQAWCDCLRKPQQAWLVYVTPHSSKPPGIRNWLSYGSIRSILESLLESVEPAPSARQLITDFCEHVSQIWRS